MKTLSRAIRRRVPYPLKLLRARAIQRTGLWRERAASRRKLILFLVPGREYISGGILSIFSLYRFSRSLEQIHGARVLMCFYPGEAHSVLRYRMFQNDVLIYPFEMVLRVCARAQQVLLHIPEYALSEVISRLGSPYLTDLRRHQGLRINILNQNIQSMPDRAVVQSLAQLVPDLTMTTAHPRYSTREQREYWGVPLHHLPAWTRPDHDPPDAFETKRDLLLVSPDPSPYRAEILGMLKTKLPGLDIRVIQNLPYEEYTKLEHAAKWALTFGEGMDGYFAGTFDRGGIGFAVYNDEFFTPEYRDLRTVYPSFDALRERMVEDLLALDNKAALESYNAQVRALIVRGWGPEKTQAALAAFYRGEYTYP